MNVNIKSTKSKIIFIPLFTVILLIVILAIAIAHVIQDETPKSKDVAIETPIENVVELIASGTGNNLVIKESSDKRELVLTDINGKELKTISKDVYVISALWSDDKSYIVCTAYDHMPKDMNDIEYVSIWMSNADGSENKQILQSNETQLMAKLSPDNSTIVYSTPTKVVSVNISTNEQKTLSEFNEFAFDSDVLYVPEVFFMDNGISFVSKSYVDGKVVSETMKVSL